MSNKPKIHAFCAAGCKWETVHMSDFLKSATFYEVGQPDGVATVDAYRKYRIFSDSNVNTGKYTASIEFQSPDATGEAYETQMTFSVSTGYRGYFDFEVMQARYNGAMLYIAYEVNGEEMVSNINLATTEYDLTKSVLKITGANQVLVYNDTAAIIGKDGGYYTPSVKDNGDGAVTISFEPSVEGMAEITPATFRIGTGTNGKSAYEIYLDNGGTIGTEKAWVESLNGTDGKSFYDMAVENGFSGSEQDLIIAMRGADGGYYTPSVKDNGDGTMTISFEPSVEGMPEVAPVTYNVGGSGGSNTMTDTETGKTYTLTVTGGKLILTEVS